MKKSVERRGDGKGKGKRKTLVWAEHRSSRNQTRTHCGRCKVMSSSRHSKRKQQYSLISLHPSLNVAGLLIALTQLTSLPTSKEDKNCSIGIIHRQQATCLPHKPPGSTAGSHFTMLVFSLLLPLPYVLFPSMVFVPLSSFLMTHRSYRVLNSERTLEVTQKVAASF